MYIYIAHIRTIIYWFICIIIERVYSVYGGVHGWTHAASKGIGCDGDDEDGMI